MSIDIDKKPKVPALKVMEILPFIPNEAIALIEAALVKQRRQHKLWSHFVRCCEMASRLDALPDVDK